MKLIEPIHGGIVTICYHALAESSGLGMLRGTSFSFCDCTRLALRCARLHKSNADFEMAVDPTTAW